MMIEVSGKNELECLKQVYIRKQYQVTGGNAPVPKLTNKYFIFSKEKYRKEL